MRAIRVLPLLSVVVLLGGGWLAPAGWAQSPKKIVFVAGPADHGGKNTGRHQYEKDLATLKYGLESSPNVRGITTKLYLGQLPRDLAEIQDAAAIVVEGSGDGLKNETHPIFPQVTTTGGVSYPPETAEWLARLDGLMKRGVGLVVLHYAMHVRHPRARAYYLDWLGGHHISGVSKTTVTDWRIGILNSGHPILRGVAPWTYREEFFTKQHLPDDARRVPLLTAAALHDGDPTPEVVAWAVEREGGGRGFVMTAPDFHENLANENNRRVLLNGIAWVARLEVPRGGVISRLAIPALHGARQTRPSRTLGDGND